MRHGEFYDYTNDCWLGAGVIICPGVTIGNRCVIALDIIDAVVKKAYPEITLGDLNKTTDRLYRELHKLLSETN